VSDGRQRDKYLLDSNIEAMIRYLVLLVIGIHLLAIITPDKADAAVMCPAIACGDGCVTVTHPNKCPTCSCPPTDASGCSKMIMCANNCKLVVGPDGCASCECYACPMIACGSDCVTIMGTDGCNSCQCNAAS